MNQHILLPSLINIIGYEQLAFLKNIKFEQWDLVLCALDYYAKGVDHMYEAYWQSYLMVLNAEMEDAESYIEAKKLYNNLSQNRATTDAIYTYIKNSICAMLQAKMISSQQFNNIAGISTGDNYFRIEIQDGNIQ